MIPDRQADRGEHGQDDSDPGACPHASRAELLGLEFAVLVEYEDAHRLDLMRIEQLRRGFLFRPPVEPLGRSVRGRLVGEDRQDQLSEHHHSPFADGQTSSPSAWRPGSV